VCGLLLPAFAAWVYWPGIAGPELLDDRSSVMVLDELGERPELAWDYILGDRSGPLGRTVSMASFVAEKLYLDDGIAGNKRVNILLHLANGALVIWLLALLLRHIGAPRHRGLAVALGALWLLHPLFVSTVLYAVQRMAMLSTFFMLLTALSYVRWRVGLDAGRGGVLRFLPVPLFFCLGMLAKENTVVIVPIVLLLEVLWFRCRDAAGEVISWLSKMSWGLIIAGGVGGLLVLVASMDYLVGRHSRRPYTLDERLLTQPRVLWDYVAQWFYPQTGRMGLYHDDVVWSRAVTEPATTLYALVAWALVLVAGALLLKAPRGRLLVFCIAWFLVGHGVESSVWPLELYFEHRNYFPAIGFALLAGVLYTEVARRWPQVSAPLLAWLSCWALGLALLTSSLVHVWSSRPLLILHHLEGHPESSRANIDMAVQMARLGSAADAHRYSARAFETSFIEREGDRAVRDLALSCIAGAPVGPRDIDRVGEFNAKRPLSSVSTLLSLVRLLQDDRCAQFDRVYFADHLADMYLREASPARASRNMYFNLAVLENALERYGRADAYIDKVLAKRPRNIRALLMKLHFTTALGRHEDAQEVIVTLQGLEQQGKLMLKDRQTLALYLES